MLMMAAQGGRTLVGAPGLPFQSSARDAARFGRLFLGGRRNGRQIIPASWVRESTTAYSAIDRGSMGYGYL